MRVNIPRGVAWLPGDSWVKIIAARFYSKSWKGGNQEGGNEKTYLSEILMNIRK